MNTIEKKIVGQQFKRSIKSYDEHAIVQKDICRKLFSILAKHHKKQDNSIFEIGAGTGFLTCEILSNSYVSKLYVNDMVEELMLPLTNILQSYPSVDYQWVMGDAEELQFPNQLDIIVSASTIQWFNNVQAFFNNSHKSLKSGGKLAFSTFGPNNFHQISSITGNGIQYKSLDELQTMLSVNFKIIEVIEETITLEFAKPEDVIRHMKQTGVNGTRNTRWTKKSLLTFCNEYEKRFNTNSGVSLTYHPLYFVCEKVG